MLQEKSEFQEGMSSPTSLLVLFAFPVLSQDYWLPLTLCGKGRTVLSSHMICCMNLEKTVSSVQSLCIAHAHRQVCSHTQASDFFLFMCNGLLTFNMDFFLLIRI